MDSIGERLIWYYIPFTDIEIPLGGVNPVTLFNALLVIVLLLGLCYWSVRRFSMLPGRAQYAMELYVGAFDQLVCNSLELGSLRENRKFFPLIGALFIYLLLCNFIGFFPSHSIEEPTADINTTLGLGIMAMGIATYCGIKVKGIGGFVEELMGPMFANKDAKGLGLVAGKLSALFFFPLNVIGELAKVVSISFRLFGNIIGGVIIIVVVTNLTLHFSWLAIGMDVFFIFFVGTVQAFVFTMLTLTYIAVAIK